MIFIKLFVFHIVRAVDDSQCETLELTSDLRHPEPFPTAADGWVTYTRVSFLKVRAGYYRVTYTRGFHENCRILNG